MRERMSQFEKTSGLRSELRTRALEEAQREKHLDWFMSTSDEEIEDEARSRVLLAGQFPAVNNKPLQLVPLEPPQAEVPLPEPSSDEELFLNTSETEAVENDQPDPQTLAGAVPNLDEIQATEPSEADAEQAAKNAKIARAKQQMIEKAIKPGGRWDPERIVGPDLASPENEKIGLDILKALAEIRMIYDPLPNPHARLRNTENATDKAIIEQLSISLKNEGAAPDITKLAQDTKCSISEVASRLAALNLSGAKVPTDTTSSPNQDKKITCSELMPLCFDYRADKAPTTQARERLAELGVGYTLEMLIN